MTITSKYYLWKRGEIYYIGYRNEAGRVQWKSTGCRVKSDALKALTEFEKLIKSRPKHKPLSQFTREFLVYASSVYAKGTCDIFTIGLNHLLAISGDCGLHLLTPEHIDKYKMKRLQDKRKPNTINAEVRGLRTIMNIAVRWKLLEENPFAHFQRVQVPEMQPCYFSKAEFQKLLAVIGEGWLRELVLFSVSTGMRRGEVVNLRWDCVDFERKQVTVQSSGTFRTKKGKCRVIPINDVAYHVLRARVGRSISPFVFTLDGERVKESRVSHRFKDYVRLAGLAEGLHWHSLRHTTATWLVQDGISLFQVQKLLGHADPGTTEIYSHIAVNDLHETMSRLVQRLN